MTTFKLNQRMNVMINFASPLCYNFLEIDNAAIEQYCYQLKDESDAMPLPGGWQSGMLNLNAPELRSLIKEINKMIEDMNDLYNLKKELTFRLTDGWVNINTPGDDQIPNNYYHMHPEKVMSFVYYVKADDNAGNLMMMSPNQMLQYIMPDAMFNNVDMFNGSKIQIPPTVGKLISFPSWLSHYAEANHSNSDRICIAFNAKVFNKVDHG